MIHATSSPAPYLRSFSSTSPVQSLTFSFLAFPSGITRRNYFLVSRHLRQYRSAKIPPAGRDCSCIRSLFFPPFIYPSSPLTWNTGAISPKHAADRRPGAGGRAGRWTRRRPRTRSLPPLPRSHILRSSFTCGVLVKDWVNIERTLIRSIFSQLNPNVLSIPMIDQPSLN